MRKTSLLLKLVIALIICFDQDTCSAQYHDFPVDEGVWVNRHTDYDWNMSNILYSTVDNYCANGNDTTINSASYKQIDHCTISATNYHGAWRYDSGQVFFIPKDSVTEFLLYDFTLNVGDTVTSIVQGEFVNPWLWYSMVDVTVDAVDTVILNGTPRRRLYIGEFEWIEGIGCTSGLFMETWWNVSNYIRSLICMSTGGEVHFGGSGIGSCSLSLNTSDLQELKKVEVFPNPTEGEFQIDLGNNYENIEIEIVNLVGQKISNQSFENVHSVQLNIEQNSGVYLVNVSSDGVRLGIISVVKN